MNKEYHLTESKTFCMLPWVHLYTTPIGVAAPCCISASISTEKGMGDSTKQPLMELVNSEKMKELRMDMLAGVKNPECNSCHVGELHGGNSFRQSANKDYGKFFDEAINNTLPDGSITKFEMRYFDIRFNNICNFKCRTCVSEFSSQWEQENLKNKVTYAKIHPKNDSPKFLQEVIDQIQFMQTAYFAGGEPLITEEHYVLLEEMIKQGRTDIKLRYNTNLSNLKFKNKDLLGLWKHFDKNIELSASIDHYGSRAEYIRNGTVWPTIEENFLNIKKLPYVNMQINTVLSIFNLLTFDKFYEYLINNKMYSPIDPTYGLYRMTGPIYLSCHILPEEYKIQGKESIEKSISLLKQHNFTKHQIASLEQVLPWLFSENIWEQNKNEFKNEVQRLDKIRGEDFSKTFPELAGLL